MIHQNEKSQSLRSNHGQPALRLDKLVPTYSLERKLAQTHVSTPDSMILDMVDEQIEKNAHLGEPWSPKLIRQTHKAALWLHNENRLLYRWVMGSH